MSTFGEISWDEDVFGGSEKKNNKDLWLRLDKGDNELRLVTQPYQYLCHRYKKEGDTNSNNYGQKVYCSMANGSCPLCEMGDKAKPRWLLGVISRKTNSFKILDISFAVFQQIRKLAKNVQRWGDPLKYDINLSVDPFGGAVGYYSVQPLPKEPLSASDQLIRDNVDLEDLKRRTNPPTPDMVQKRIDRINGDETALTPAPATSFSTASKATNQVVKKQVKNQSVATVSLAEDDDDDEDFPSYEEK